MTTMNTRFLVALLLVTIADVASAFTTPLGHQTSPFAFVTPSYPALLRSEPLAAASTSSSSSSDTPLQQSLPSKPTSPRTLRRVRTVQKNARLPVWPAWNGVLLWAVNRVAGDAAAAKLENVITGRVCPNFFTYPETTPFIMLVHHCHSFAPWDPLRFLQRTFFPEGFPAHPHRGFVTVTYFLDGGFLHRDSMGVQQTYGAEKRHGGKHTQWLSTGGGILHEEMYDLAGDNGGFMPQRQELYQLWLNVGADYKLETPDTVLLGGEEETPLVTLTDDQGRQTETIVLAGEYQGRRGAAPLHSDLAILHVRVQAGATWSYTLPANFETVILYLRQGSLLAEEGSVSLPVHHTVQFQSTGNELILQAPENEAADFMLLAGEPIREPCVAQGSMVMNTASEINKAYADYQSGTFGLPWSEKLSNEEWRNHVKKYPSRY